MIFGSVPNNSSSTMSSSKIEPPLLNIVIVIHLFIIALALLGNLLIIYLVVINMRLRNARNAFMLNLTLSNILLVTICTPSFLISISSRGWTMGTFWCKFLHSVQIVVVLVSAFSIAMIAIDRWIFVVYSHKNQLKNTHVCAIIIGIWTLAIVLSIPTFIIRQTDKLYDDSFFNRIKELETKFVGLASFTHQQDSGLNNILSNNSNPNSAYQIPTPNNSSTSSQITWNFMKGNLRMVEQENSIYCFENWSDPVHKRVYILVLFVLEFVLPCLAMLITYIWIIRFLKMHDDKMNHYELLHKRLVQKERHHQKNCKILSVLCLTFIVCCLPLSFFNIKSEFDLNEYVSAAASSSTNNVDDVTPKQKEIYWSLTLLTTLEEMNAILSPLLYGWMNHNFRNAINEKLKTLKSNIKKNRKNKTVQIVV